MGVSEPARAPVERFRRSSGRFFGRRDPVARMLPQRTYLRGWSESGSWGPVGRPVTGEVMLGTAESPTTDPLGFFIIPADGESNNVRVYVVVAATRAIYRIVPTVRSKGRSSPAGGDRALLAAPAALLLSGRLLSWLTR
jgi:hypothetical protein